MALTMTRTRTQTTLTKLAELVANVHGELAFLDDMRGKPGPRGAVDARRLKLVGDRDALYATLRQFDAAIDPESIGIANAWRKRFGERLSPEGLLLRYVAWLQGDKVFSKATFSDATLSDSQDFTNEESLFSRRKLPVVGI
jgi:hypothetical protein